MKPKFRFKLKGDSIRKFLLESYYKFLSTYPYKDSKLMRQIWYFASPKPYETMLVVGCGDGRIIYEGLHLFPQTHFIGIDSDQGKINAAKNWLGKMRPDIKLLENYSDKIFLNDHTVNGLVCFLTLHTLSTEAKKSALQEFKRILIPGGRFVVADFGKAGLVSRLSKETDAVNDNLKGLIPNLLVEAGFIDVAEVAIDPFGIRIYMCKK